MTGYAYRWTAYGRTGLRPSLRVAHTLTTDSPTLIGATCPHLPALRLLLDLFFFQKPSRKRLPTDNPAGAIQEGNPLHTPQKLGDSNAGNSQLCGDCGMGEASFPKLHDALALRIELGQVLRASLIVPFQQPFPFSLR